MLLPTIISFVATSLVSGAAVSFIGYYTAFVIAGAAFHSVGNGLITTFSASTPESRWIGFQVILGIGAGMGAQASMLPAQTVLKSKDIALGLAVLNFASIVSGAIFSSVAESIYANTLTSGFRQAGIHAETDTTANGGLTSVAANLTGSTLVAAKEVYDHGVRNIFDLATALACVSIIGAVGVEWISVKKDEKESGEGEESSRT